MPSQKSMHSQWGPSPGLPNSAACLLQVVSWEMWRRQFSKCNCHNPWLGALWWPFKLQHQGSGPASWAYNVWLCTGSWAQMDPALSLTLCCCHREILNCLFCFIFCFNKGPTFSSFTGSQKLWSQSRLGSVSVPQTLQKLAYHHFWDHEWQLRLWALFLRAQTTTQSLGDRKIQQWSKAPYCPYLDWEGEATVTSLHS